MTAPAPGFPPELETAIAQALAEHAIRNVHVGSARECKACDRHFDDPSSFAAFQAAVVMEVIAQHTTTEWGVRSEHHIGDYTSPARSEGHADGMLRGYAKYGAQSQKFARLVLPWQEVKA